ncbi:DNA topoisomerase-1 [Catalinimonas alkaloidigena]|uniref:DNA topoisomerase n=1 Tax=Catalinimonas alkaloidigena TaxID=1075417 RepID=A0A1G9ELX5_9BACT|nr:DNA topoisomerase IB [Catalinimonas alkaloidigena]SDK77051.1 DNA topoisomerase-1 [Catalinimonas alkaloidigena]
MGAIALPPDAIAPPNLTYTADTEAGYTRVRKGRGFAFLDAEGKYIKNEHELERLRGLGIPPAYTDVWICSAADGHLQATGRDERGRKQYLYHPDWTDYRNRTKFYRLLQFGQNLPLIRETVERDLRQRKWTKTKVLALVTSLLDESFIRIGNMTYVRQNKTFGLTTLRRKHIHEEGKSITFEYKAKSGKNRKVKIQNRRLARLVKQCAELPGYEVFKYWDEDGERHRIDSQDVNHYLNEITGQSFTAKDFRTWGGSTLALLRLEEACDEVSTHPRKKLQQCLVKKVAELLGNTVAVCREYYIHPAVLQAVEDGTVADFMQQGQRKYRRYEDYLKPEEMQLMAIMEAEAHAA